MEEEDEGQDTEDEIEQAEGQFESSTRVGHSGANEMHTEQLNDMLHTQRGIRSGGLLSEFSLMWRKLFWSSKRDARISYNKHAQRQ